MNEEFKGQGKDRIDSKSSEKKSFYSVNLNESKIILIFVGFVFVIVIGIFGTLMIMSSINSNKKNAKNEIKDRDMSTNDYNFYSELTGEDVSGLKDPTSDVVKVLDARSEVNNEKTITEKVVTDNNLVSKVENKIDNLDNEVIYSSKFNETKKSDLKLNNTQKVSNSLKKSTNTNTVTKKIENNKKVVVNTKKVEVKKTISTKKYVVQIASYTNKKSADEVLQYYQNVGYPTYIK